MSGDYLKPTDPGAFKDCEKLPIDPFLTHNGRKVVECGKCKGHGGWNLKLDEYGPGKHFKAGCDNCNSWGYVSAKQGDHVHEWGQPKTLSMCNTRYTCATCKETMDVDSSD